MADAAFNPPVSPSFPLDDAHTPRVNRAQFGDAYVQRSADGINADMEKPTVKWENLTQTEYLAIWNFFVGLAGVGSFTYTLPWAPGGSPNTYICPTYSRNMSDAGVYSITCNWEQIVEA